MATAETKLPMTHTDAPESANVDKIREIIFGSQMRDYERRFARLEERLTADAQALRDDTRKRIDTLEAFVQKEIDSLSQRLKAEKSERAESLKEIGRELRETAQSGQNRLSQLDDQFAKDAAALRSQLLEQSKQLTADAEDKYRAISAALDRESQSLRSDKADRETLADLFVEMSMRMRNELKLPEQK